MELPDHLHPTELERLGVAYSRLAGRLGHGDGDGLCPTRVAELAAEVVPHARHCGITLVRPQRPPETVAASAPLLRRLDRLQQACREGPCLQGSSDVVVVDDLGTAGRWPVFGPRCVAATGLHSVLAVPLPVGGGNAATLTLYAPGTGAFDELDRRTAAALAPFAALAVQHAIHDHDVSNLNAALATSRQIGTAVGIVMSRHRVTSDQAFALLRRASQQLNRKLRDVAEEVETTGELPPLPRRRPRRSATPRAPRQTADG